MIDGYSNFKETNQNTDSAENKSTSLDKLQNGLEKVASKISEIFSDDQKENTETETSESSDTTDTTESQDSGESEKQNDTKSSFKDLFEMLFSDDFIENLKQSIENSTKDNNEADVEKPDPVIEKIAKSISTPEGIKALIEKHPEKAELWKSYLEAIEKMNDPDASPVEIKKAQSKLSQFKGDIMEIAAKDALIEAGFDVEDKQRVVNGENGATKPDVIAVNNTDKPIEVFGTTIQPGETLSIECKCAGSEYIKNQLNNHIPNQLSGQEGTRILLTTADVKETPEGLATGVCEKYGAKLVVLDVSVSDVEKAIKEVAGE